MNDDQAPGPVLIGLRGTALEGAEGEWLQHPSTGGVVLFSRNYDGPEQLRDLVGEIRARSRADLLICVDHEGGRVQRFREGFTRLPPLAVLGRMHGDSPERARDFAYRHARVMATELLVHGVDLSFAPVLDLGRASRVIGDRAFAPDPDVVADLAGHYLAGMHDAGMRTCGKHFPGHGSVGPDSHTEDVVDERTRAEIEASDLVPFAACRASLDSIMMAHVTYPRVDERPAGYSGTWIREVLRERLAFTGTVFSDDLGMHAAGFAGKLADRARRSLQAGCDAVLVCDPDDVQSLLTGADRLEGGGVAVSRLRGRPTVAAGDLDRVGEWRHWQHSLEELEHTKWA